MDNLGFIKLNRSMLQWEWYQDSVTKIVFLHCLLTANWEDRSWRGITIKRGQLLTSQKSLAKQLGLTRQPIRRALLNLQKTNELTIKATSKYTIITVVNYDKYQQDNQQNNQQKTNEQPTSQPTSNQQPTTLKEIKEQKEYKNIYSVSARTCAPAREENPVKNLSENGGVVAAYKTICTNLEPLDETGVKNYIPALARLNDALVNDYITHDQVIQAFKKANANDYLTGKVNGFIPDFAWMINPGHILDILNGKYERSFKSGGSKKPKVEIMNHNYNLEELQRRKLQGG